MGLGGPELLIIALVLGLPLLLAVVVLLLVRASRSAPSDAPRWSSSARETDHRPPPPAP